MHCRQSGDGGNDQDEAAMGLDGVTAARPAPLSSSPPAVQTGIPSLPSLPPRRIVQLCGGPASYKTHVALALAKATLCSDQSVIWLDTSNASRDIANYLGSSPDVVAISLTAVEHAAAVLRALLEDHAVLSVIGKIPEEGDLSRVVVKARLLVLDSLGALIAPLMGLRTTDAWSGHVALNEIAVLLRQCATQLSVTVVVVNRTVGGDVPRPALGNLWSSFADVTVTLERTRTAHDGANTDPPEYRPAHVKVQIASKARGSVSSSVLSLRDGVLAAHEPIASQYG